jgi:ATP synthase protein I
MARMAAKARWLSTPAVDLRSSDQMQGSYAVILRRSALATVPAAVAMIVLSFIVGGSKGLTGALLGVGLVIIFFGISAFAMSQAARHSPQVMMVTAVTTYLVKILALLFIVAKYSGTTAFNGKLFGFTVVVCVIVWTTAQVLVSARLKVPYVEPDGKR